MAVDKINNSFCLYSTARRPICGEIFKLRNEERIVGGSEVRPHSLPFQVPLFTSILQTAFFAWKYTQLFSIFSLFFYFFGKRIWAKTIRKMLLKFTTMVNFINILQINFSWDSVIWSFSLLIFCFVNFCWQNIGAKAACKMSVNLTIPGCQFHQQFTYKRLFVQICFAQLFSSYSLS